MLFEGVENTSVGHCVWYKYWLLLMKLPYCMCRFHSLMAKHLRAGTKRNPFQHPTLLNEEVYIRENMSLHDSVGIVIRLFSILFDTFCLHILYCVYFYLSVSFPAYRMWDSIPFSFSSLWLWYLKTAMRSDFSLAESYFTFSYTDVREQSTYCAWRKIVSSEHWGFSKPSRSILATR